MNRLLPLPIRLGDGGRCKGGGGKTFFFIWVKTVGEEEGEGGEGGHGGEGNFPHEGEFPFFFFFFSSATAGSPSHSSSSSSTFGRFPQLSLTLNGMKQEGVRVRFRIMGKSVLSKNFHSLLSLYSSYVRKSTPFSS